MSIFSWFKPSVDGIIADIAKKVTQLENAVLHHNTQAAVHQAAADASDVLAAAAASEAERASAIGAKLKALITP